MENFGKIVKPVWALGPKNHYFSASGCGNFIFLMYDTLFWALELVQNSMVHICAKWRHMEKSSFGAMAV